jgi:hypothetical protein
VANYVALPRQRREFDSPLPLQVSKNEKGVLMENDDDAGPLTKEQQERLEKFIAQMNVYSQHQSVMAETRQADRGEKKSKNKKL